MCFVHFSIIFTGVMGVTSLGVVKITEIKMVLVKIFSKSVQAPKILFFFPVKPSLDSTDGLYYKKNP